MNLIPALARNTEKGAEIQIECAEDKTLSLIDPRKIARLTNGEEIQVIVGLRPEDITNPETRDGRSIQVANCLVDVVEPAGSDTYLVTRLGGRNVTARMRADTAIRAGETAALAFDLEKASYFAPETGERLN